MKKYISTFVLVVIVILLVGAIGYTFKQIIQKDKELAVLTQQNQDLREKVDELNKQIESIQDEKNNNEQEEVAEETTDEVAGIIPVLDESKISNKQENTSITEYIYDDNGTISISVDNSTNSLNIFLNAVLARQIYGYNGQSDSHTIAGISEKIIDARVVSTGTDSKGVKVIMLFESGNVKYINIDNILDKTYAVKNVENAEDITNLIEVNVINNETGKTSLEVVGIKTDGSAVILTF